jgi:hypothetical protein
VVEYNIDFFDFVAQKDITTEKLKKKKNIRIVNGKHPIAVYQRKLNEKFMIVIFNENDNGIKKKIPSTILSVKFST